MRLRRPFERARVGVCHWCARGMCVSVCVCVHCFGGWCRCVSMRLTWCVSASVGERSLRKGVLLRVLCRASLCVELVFVCVLVSLLWRSASRRCGACGCVPTAARRVRADRRLSPPFPLPRIRRPVGVAAFRAFRLCVLAMACLVDVTFGSLAVARTLLCRRWSGVVSSRCLSIASSQYVRACA